MHLLHEIRNVSLQQVQDSVRRHLSAILIVVGVLLLGYVGVEYGDMFWTQHQLQKQWADQQRTLDTQPGSEPQSVVDDGLTRLTIPKIELAAVVVEGTSHHQLLLGPGHIKETAAPGENGNAVISAHRDTFFRHIYELEKGDELLVQRKGRTFKYQVVSKRIVQPTDMSVLDQNKDESLLTLITCYPIYYIGPAPKRLVVVSKLVDGGSEKDADAATPGVRKTSLQSPTSAIVR